MWQRIGKEKAEWVAFRIPGEIIKAVKRLARRTGMSVSELYRRPIIETYEREVHGEKKAGSRGL